MVGCGLWAVGCGLWAVGCGLWDVKLKIVPWIVLLYTIIGRDDCKI